MQAGFWSFVFPCGVYANAWNLLGTNLRNDGLKGYGAACSVATLLLWLFCAVMSAYTGNTILVRLFYQPLTFI